MRMRFFTAKSRSEKQTKELRIYDEFAGAITHSNFRIPHVPQDPEFTLHNIRNFNCFKQHISDFISILFSRANLLQQDIISDRFFALIQNVSFHNLKMVVVRVVCSGETPLDGSCWKAYRGFLFWFYQINRINCNKTNATQNKSQP